MAQEYLASGSTSLANANWRLDDGTAGSGFAAGSTLTITDGSQAITAGLDQSAVAAGLYFTVERLFSGSIGTSASSPFIYAFTDGGAAEKDSANTEGYFKYFASGGNCYLKATGTTSGTNSIDNVFQNSPGAKLWLVANLFTYVHLEAGALDVNTNVTLTNFEAWGGASAIDLQASATAITTCNIYGGTHTIKRTCTTLNIYGGNVTYDFEGSTATTTVNQYAGTLVQRSGPITTHNHFGGLHDVSNMRRKTTNATCIRKPGSSFKGTRSGGLLTITTDKNIGFLTLVS